MKAKKAVVLLARCFSMLENCFGDEEVTVYERARKIVRKYPKMKFKDQNRKLNKIEDDFSEESQEEDDSVLEEDNEDDGSDANNLAEVERVPCLSREALELAEVHPAALTPEALRQVRENVVQMDGSKG